MRVKNDPAASLEGDLLALYGKETYPNIEGADDMIATLVYIDRVRQYGDPWSDEKSLSLLAPDWPLEGRDEILALIAHEPAGFAKFFETANSTADQILGR